MGEMYRRYHKSKEEQALVNTVRVTRSSIRESIKCIGRSTYLDLATTLTGNSEKITRSVDYVTDVLINERVHTLQRIINNVVAPTKKGQMTHGLTLVQNFLKYQYDEHAKRAGDEVSVKYYTRQFVSEYIHTYTFSCCRFVPMDFNMD